MTQQITETIIPTELGRALLRTKCPFDAITDEMIAKKCRQAMLTTGDELRVQCWDKMDDQNARLQAQVDYVVTARTTGPKMIEKPDGSMHQETAIGIEVVRLGDWRLFYSREQVDLTVKWNVGQKHYDVLRGDEVVASHADKEVAQQIAAEMGAA